MSVAAYADSLEHLRDELVRLDLMLRRALVLARLPGAVAGPEEFRGLVISESEVDTLLTAPDLLGQRWRQESAAAATLRPIDDRLAALRETIDARLVASRRAGVNPALLAVAERFGLSLAEMDLLLVALAPEVEPHYETLYAYLQNDVTRKRPSVDLTLNLVCRSDREKIFARRFLAPGAALVRGQLVHVHEEPHDRHPSLLRQFLKVDDAVVGFVLDQPPSLEPPATLIESVRTPADLEVEPATRTALGHLVTLLARSGAANPLIRLVGPPDAELADVAETLAHALGRRLVLADFTAGAEADERRLAALVRDATLHEAAIAIAAAESPPGEGEEQRGARDDRLWRALESFAGPVLLLGPAAAFARTPGGRRLWRLAVPPPPFDVRRRAWDTALAGTSGIDTARLADTFRFGSRRVRQAVDIATGLAALRDPDMVAPSSRDLFAAGRVLTAPNLRRFAVLVEPRYRWGDIVLPVDKLEQLRSVAARMKLRHVVHGDWGFGEKLSRGKGLTVLFAGPSGTGKTMAAEVLASELALDLYQIDLSTVVNKYIGETEKNLSAIFREAEQSQVLLFFDEADALFGKRTEIKDAHDRYANIEINYLLQRIEQFEGVVVLATNLQRNLDDAFLRRMQDVVEFPFPDEDLRERIWRAHFPPATPRDPRIDFPFLARQFKFTGGNIRNVVLNAAFLAAHESRPIGMGDLILAIKAELQKLGRLAVKADFGPYYELIQQRGEAPLPAGAA